MKTKVVLIIKKKEKVLKCAEMRGWRGVTQTERETRQKNYSLSNPEATWSFPLQSKKKAMTVKSEALAPACTLCWPRPASV